MACSWVSYKTSIFAPSSSSSSSRYSDAWKLPRFSTSSNGPPGSGCKCRLEAGAPPKDLKFVLHDALDSSGLNTSHARVARENFCAQIRNLSDLERETSICVNRGVDLGRAALYIAAEDDSLISHSSVPLPVDDFIDRLDNLSVDYCSHYGSAFRSSPENFLECLEKYLYVNKGFQRTTPRNQVEQRSLYLHSVLTHRSGSASMLSLIYSEILKMLRLFGLLNFDVEIYFPHDSHSFPRGYCKQKSTESDHLHVLTSQSLLVEMLKDLKDAFWPFQRDHSRSLFIRAAQAADCSYGSNNKESALELASAKAAQHRLERGIWTSVRFGDMRRALSACERLILLETQPEELRDYGILLYHCGFYEEALRYLRLYQEGNKSSEVPEEKEALEKLIVRINLILMEEGWSKHSDKRKCPFKNSEPW